jgi:hypothetical protein
LHIHQSFFAFLHNRDLLENGGVFVTRARSLASLAPKGNIMKPGGADLSKMNPTMVVPLGGMVGSGAMGRGPRDRDIGLTVCVVKGPHKGYVGNIKDTNGPIARVELRTGNKVITLEKNKLRERLYVAARSLPLVEVDVLIYMVSDRMESLLSSRVVVLLLNPIQWVHLMDMVVLAVVLLALEIPIPTPLDHERQATGASAEPPMLMLGMPGRHLGTRHLALRTRMQMEEKHQRGMHRREHPTLMPMVGRRRLGMRIQGRRTPMSAVVEGRDGQLPAGQLQRLPDMEVRRRGGLVDGVRVIVGAMILGYVNVSLCSVLL